MKILLIEDNPADRDLIIEHLNNIPQQIDIDASDNLTNAIEKLSNGKYDFILLDLCLPESNGLDTVHRVQECLEQNNGNRKTPIVILTGENDYNVGKNALSNGVKDFLTKDDLNTKNLRRCINFNGYDSLMPKRRTAIFNMI